jgi:small subunit ribosomal protein S2
MDSNEKENKTSVTGSQINQQKQHVQGASGTLGDMSVAPVEINIRTLLEAGAHYGHQKDKWNPKMIPYIYGVKNRINIINLDKTLKLWDKAKNFIINTTTEGGTVLFVGTKIQARQIVKDEAERCGAFHITRRWLGGTLTNFQTIRNSIDRMKKLEELLKKSDETNSDVKISKKEKLSISRDLEKLYGNIGGVRSMKRVPDVLFVLDVNKEHIAVTEAKKMKIPVVALVDTNVDPDFIDYPIPSNDDASRTLKLFIKAIADAIIEGSKQYEKNLQTMGDSEMPGQEVRSSSRHRFKGNRAPQKRERSSGQSISATSSDEVGVANKSGDVQKASIQKSSADSPEEESLPDASITL